MITRVIMIIDCMITRVIMFDYMQSNKWRSNNNHTPRIYDDQKNYIDCMITRVINMANSCSNNR